MAYKTKSDYEPVQVKKDIKDKIRSIQDDTKIPMRHITNMALEWALSEKKFRVHLSHTFARSIRL